jgi:REP element-mobilizing transposase RayT
MCSLFRNKYRVESCRLKGHDYSCGSKYFITICTQGRDLWFGNILNHQLILSESGKIADELWRELPKHFPYVSLDEFVVMPDHVHGIVIINTQSDAADTLQSTVETLHATSLQQQQQQQNPKNEFMSSISPKPGSLAIVIRSYKSAVSKNVHLYNPVFSWQPRYYDHLIRSDLELNRIRRYIINNPGKWEDPTEAMEEFELR